MAQQSAGARRRVPRSEEDPVDSFDVPAAILCAVCGQGDCPGCSAATENESGVIAIVPWERSGAGVWPRLWETATATTQGAEAFFAVLPDGAIRPAMRFALLAELLAVTSLGALLLPVAVIVFPNLLLEVARSPSLQAAALRWIVVAVPGLALLTMAAHITHGAALDVSASRQGAHAQRRRAVRFGLYACGWDLMACPLGAIVTASAKGLGAAMTMMDLALRAPGPATVALLQGVYNLPPAGVARARRIGSVAATIIVVVAALIVLASLVFGLIA